MLGLAFSCFIETTQLLTRLGCFDVMDMFHNTMGACFGYLIYYKLLRKKNLMIMRNTENQTSASKGDIGS